MYRTAFFALLAAHAFNFESIAQTPAPTTGPGKATDKAPPGAPNEPTGWSGSQNSGDPKPDPAPPKVPLDGKTKGSPGPQTPAPKPPARPQQ